MSDAAPEPKANMGPPEPRLDARLKVTGEARYGSDFPVGNPAYAFLVTSAIARGRIERLDLAGIVRLGEGFDRGGDTSEQTGLQQISTARFHLGNSLGAAACGLAGCDR